MIKRLALVAIALFFTQVISGCMSQSKTPSVSSAPVSSSLADPNDPNTAKERFQAKIKEDIERITPRLKEEITNSGDQYNAEYSGNYSYDIQKSDSIVSPYLGIADFEIKWFHNGEYVSDMSIKANYAYQDGQWVLKKAIRYVGDEPTLDVKAVGNLQWTASLFQ